MVFFFCRTDMHVDGKNWAPREIVYSYNIWEKDHNLFVVHVTSFEYIFRLIVDVITVYIIHMSD